MSWRIRISTSVAKRHDHLQKSSNIHFGFNQNSVRLKSRHVRAHPYSTMNRPISVEKRSKRFVLVCGQNICGQLGLSPTIIERQKPQHLTIKNYLDEDESIQWICTGAMHSCALTTEGRVYSWGCNDDGALGRITDDIDEEYQPTLCSFPEQIQALCAGDSFTVALGKSGRVYLTGCFRSSAGRLGLLQPKQMVSEPILLPFDQTVKDIACGADFCLLLTEQGDVYSFGNNEAGQLGRDAEPNLDASMDEHVILTWLRPSLIRAFQGQQVLKMWAGGHGFFALVQGNTRRLYSAGANNFGQLGHLSRNPISTPMPIESLTSEIDVLKIACGLQHTLLLDSIGHVFGLGRSDDGRLGSLTGDILTPQQIPDLNNIIDIAAGGGVSFAIDAHRQSYSFGMGDTLQTGHGNEDVFQPRRVVSKQLEGRTIEQISVGAQHSLFLVCEYCSLK